MSRLHRICPAAPDLGSTSPRVDPHCVAPRKRGSRRRVYVLTLFFAVSAASGSAHALCCTLASGGCDPAADNAVACLLAHGTSDLDRVCTASGCAVPTPAPDVEGCCELPILGCTVDRPAACGRLHGTFYTDRRCGLLGCIPPTASHTPTRTSTATATKSRTPTVTANATTTATNSPLPTATITASATQTDTPSPSETPTSTSTPTQSPTVTAADTATSTATATGTVTLTPTETATPVPTATDTPSATPTATTDPCVAAHALTDPPTIDQIWVEDTQANLDGSTKITVEGSQDNTVVAFWTDPRACASDPPPTFHWVITTPNTIGYTARGISGYQDDTLVIEADSIPNFVPEAITVTFTITSQVPNSTGPLFSTTKTFRMLYQNSALTLSMSTTCQTMQSTGPGCDIEAALAVPPGTPT